MSAFCNSIALVSILLPFSSSLCFMNASNSFTNILLRELMPVLSDDKASDNIGFDNKMLENELEIKEEEPINSI